MPIGEPYVKKGYANCVHYKKIVCIETSQIFDSAKDLSKIINVPVKDIRRQLNGERYCTIPYRYVGKENVVKFKPVRLKKEKPPKKERPPRKVYIPHPAVYRKMIMFDVNGNELQTFNSSGEAAKFVNSNAETFRKAIKKSPNNFTKGFIWKYA